MAANKLNQEMNETNNNSNTENTAGGLKSLCIKYKKFIAAGAMLLLLAVVIASYQATNAKNGDGGKNAVGNIQNGQGKEALEEFKIDEYPQINALFEEYFKYYASGDTDSLEKIAYPVSDTEKSYIKLFSQYLDCYENIKCYTKKGVADDEFIVSAALDMKFKNIKTAAPDLGFFYVRKNSDGAYYIDNTYSLFNQSNQADQQTKTDSEINTLMTEFEQGEDVAALQKQIQKDYDKALSSDSDLEKMVKDTLQDVISDWVASFGPATDGETNKPDGKDGQTVDEGRAAYTTTQVNLRKKRSTDSDAIKVLKKGAKVTVYGESKDGWYKVKAGNDTGYVSDEYIKLQKTDTEDGNTETKPDKETGTDKETNTKEEERTAYAKTQVNLRKKRSTNSDIIKTLKAGAKVTVYGESKDGWYKVKAGNDTGYVSDEYIVSDVSEVEKSDDQTRTAYAKTKVNVRKRRSINSRVLKTLKAGTELTVYGKSTDGWYKVTAKGKTGYIKDDYVVFNKSKVKKEENNSQQPSTNSRYYHEGDRITLSESVNVRASMSENADRVGLAYKGDVVTVIMSYAEGWTKVTWNGQTGYIKTEYLR